MRSSTRHSASAGVRRHPVWTHLGRAPWREPVPPRSLLPYMQGALYFIIGTWSILSNASLVPGTDPRLALILTQSMGVGLALVGTLLLGGAMVGVQPRHLAMLGLLSASAALLVNVAFVVLRVAPPFYLLHASADAVLIVLWLTLLRSERRNVRRAA